VDEIAFIDVQPDRATDLVQAELRAKAAIYAGRATLLYVRFEEMSNWRRNAHLLHAACDLGLAVLPLPPEPILTGGERFDPVAHFAQWRELDKSTRTRLKRDASQGLRLALAEVPEGNGRWETIAERLNGAAILTSGGGRWTAENVRKHASRLGLAGKEVASDAKLPLTRSCL
jgi:hypothetical protein